MARNAHLSLTSSQTVFVDSKMELASDSEVIKYIESKNNTIQVLRIERDGMGCVYRIHIKIRGLE
jgi:hypothetical protein